MVITFPNMGHVSLAARAFFEGAGIPCVAPLPNNRETLRVGASQSPEEICLPFKVIMGNYIESLERGADTILITGSCGPCRFGEYCEVQMKLLEKMGRSADFIVLDSPGEIGREELKKRLGRFAGACGLGTAKLLLTLREALHILKLADEIDAKAHMTAGYEANRGECKRLLAECGRAVNERHGPEAIRETLRRYRERLDRVPLDTSRRPLKVALIGEIYSMIEPFSNLYIEEKLMDYGVCSKRLLTPSWWVRDLALKPLKINSRGIFAAAQPYIPLPVGGHARESIGHAVTAREEHMDGVIQVFPVGCMPEIVAKAVLPAVGRDGDFPTLTLIMDEMSGEAGYLTRIEAFIDMLEARRRRSVRH